MEAIMRRIDTQDLVNARVRLVISNNSRSGALQLARRRGVEARHISGSTHPDPEAYAEAVEEALKVHRIGLILLAGYMKRLPETVVRSYAGRALNIHPALLPLFGGKGMYGTAVHRAVIEAGAGETGVTVHYVDEGYDTGAIIRQEKVPVLPDDSPEILAARVLEVEHDLYWRIVNDIVNPAVMEGGL